MAPSSFARPYSGERSSVSPSGSVGQSPRREFTLDIERWRNRTTCAPSDNRPLRELADSAGYTSPATQMKFHKSQSNQAKTTEPRPRSPDHTQSQSQSQSSHSSTECSPDTAYSGKSPAVKYEASPLKLTVGNETRKPLTRQLFNKEEKASCASKNVNKMIVGGGLSNLGNTCYMNATLQTLTHTPAFTERLRAHAEEKNGEPGHEAVSCMLCILNEHVKKSFHSSGESFRPTSIHSNLARIGKEFVPYRQEDAHEFLRLLLDACDIEGCDIVDKVFGGKIRTGVTCSVCSTTSGTVDPVQDLSLEIDDTDVDSVNAAFRKFTARETLDGDNSYECETCDKKVKARKQIVLRAVPEITVIQLKRFKVVTKICNDVAFTKKIELDEVHSTDEEYVVEASLYSVIVHTGSSKSTGHYYAYIKGSDKRWRKFDDSSVYEVSWDEVKRSQAYMLFYKKVSVTQKPPVVKPEKTAASVSRSTVTSQVKRGVVGACRHILQLKKKKPNEGPASAAASSVAAIVANGDAPGINGISDAKTVANGVASCENKTLHKNLGTDTEVSSPGLKLVMAYE